MKGEELCQMIPGLENDRETRYVNSKSTVNYLDIVLHNGCRNDFRPKVIGCRISPPQKLEQDFSFEYVDPH